MNEAKQTLCSMTNHRLMYIGEDLNLQAVLVGDVNRQMFVFDLSSFMADAIHIQRQSTNIGNVQQTRLTIVHSSDMNYAHFISCVLS